jgi:hypothetical protein
MDKAKISYAGVGAAVAGVIGILGIYSAWWETDFRTYNGTADISGQLALAMSIGLCAFGAAYVLMSDPRIRRAMGLMTCARGLTPACVWVLRTDNAAPGAEVRWAYSSRARGVLGTPPGSSCRATWPGRQPDDSLRLSCR